MYVCIGVYNIYLYTCTYDSYDSIHLVPIYRYSYTYYAHQSTGTGAGHFGSSVYCLVQLLPPWIGIWTSVNRDMLGMYSLYSACHCIPYLVYQLTIFHNATTVVNSNQYTIPLIYIYNIPVIHNASPCWPSVTASDLPVAQWRSLVPHRSWGSSRPPWWTPRVLKWLEFHHIF